MGLKPRDSANAGVLNGSEFIPIDTGANVAEMTTPANIKTYVQSDLGTAAFEDTSAFAPALGSDDNYVTDAELTVIQNTSGVNTGDQDLTGYATTSHASTHIADTGADPLHAFDVNAMSYHGWLSRDMTIGATPVTYGPVPRELTSTTFTLYGTRSTCTYYYQATKVIVTTDKTCTLDDGAGGSTAGLYFVYFDGVTGNILATKTFPGVFFTSNVLIATVTWNGTAFGWVNDERHGYQRNGVWHYNQHKYVGALYDSGIDFATANSGAGLTFSTTSGSIADEDIAFTVNASSTFPTANTCKLIRQTGSSTYTTEDTVSTKPFYWNGGTTRVRYVNAAGPYALADVNSARYINVWVYATTDLNTPIVAIAETLPTATTGYTTIALARAITPPNLSNLAISPEMKILYRLIMTGAGTVAETTDYRRSSPLPGGGTASTSAAAVSYTPTTPLTNVTVQGALDQLATGLAGVDASGFNSNLATTDNTLQEIANKVDALRILKSANLENNVEVANDGIWAYVDGSAELVMAASYTSLGNTTEIIINSPTVNFVGVTEFIGTPFIENPTPYDNGTKDANFTIDPANGACQYVTIGNSATTGISMTISQPSDLTKCFTMDLRVVRSSGNQRVVTLLAGDANIISSGGLLSSGDVLPSSGVSTTDLFQFKFDATLDKYIPINALFDVKS